MPDAGYCRAKKKWKEVKGESTDVPKHESIISANEQVSSLPTASWIHADQPFFGATPSAIINSL